MSSSNWFLIMIGSIFMAVLAFVFGTTLFGYESEQQAREVGIFIVMGTNIWYVGTESASTRTAKVID